MYIRKETNFKYKCRNVNRNTSIKQVYPFMPTASHFLQRVLLIFLILVIYYFGIERSIWCKCPYATWLFIIFINKKEIARLGIDSL